MLVDNLIDNSKPVAVSVQIISKTGASGDLMRSIDEVMSYEETERERDSDDSKRANSRKEVVVPALKDPPGGAHSDTKTMVEKELNVLETALSEMPSTFTTSEETDTPFYTHHIVYRYYHELDAPDEGSPEFLFHDMDLEDLYGFAGTLDSEHGSSVDFKLLSRVYYSIFIMTRAVSDIQKAIQGAERAKEIAPADGPDYQSCLKDLAVMFLKKYECTGLLEDLDGAIFSVESMLNLTPPIHPDRQSRVEDLDLMKSKRATRTGSSEDREEVLTAAQHAMQEAKWSQLRHYIESFHRTEDFRILNKVIEEYGEFIEAMTGYDPNKARMLNNLAKYLCVRFRRTGDSKDLRMAIEQARSALDLVHDDSERASILSALGVYF